MLHALRKLPPSEAAPALEERAAADGTTSVETVAPAPPQEEQAGLKASDSEVHGLGEVTTAEAFHAALPPGAQGPLKGENDRI